MANTSIEYTAANAEDAIEKGLKTLGLTRDQVDVDVLDNGSRGIFGIGGRQARVRISLKEDTLRASMEQSQVKSEPKPEVKEKPAQVEKPVEKNEEKKPEKKPETRKPERKHEKPAQRPEKNAEKPERKPAKHIEKEIPAADKEAEAAEDTGEPKHSSSDVINEETMQIAANVVRDLMEKMRVKAEISSRIADGADEIDSRVILIDIKGDDLSYLIGRHSEVLHSLQYITSLIVGREVGHWVPLVIDIQGYRERRERQLRQMAATMADQVVKTGRRISLEPMPATERRIIHLALRGNHDVTTESVGDEPNRKVMISPKERK